MGKDPSFMVAWRLWAGEFFSQPTVSQDFDFVLKEHSNYFTH